MSDGYGQTILILGGGVGGLVAANELRTKLSKEHRIVLVDRETTCVFSLLWLMTGDRTASRISRPLARLQKKGIDLMRGEIEAIDPKQRQVTVQGQVLSADYLVIALGADLASDSVPGLSEAGHNFYSLPAAENFRDAFRDFSGGKLVVLTATPAYKCPASRYEAAMLVQAACRERGIQTPKDSIRWTCAKRKRCSMSYRNRTLINCPLALYLCRIRDRFPSGRAPFSELLGR